MVAPGRDIHEQAAAQQVIARPIVDSPGRAGPGVGRSDPPVPGRTCARSIGFAAASSSRPRSSHSSGSRSQRKAMKLSDVGLSCQAGTHSSKDQRPSRSIGWRSTAKQPGIELRELTVHGFIRAAAPDAARCACAGPRTVPGGRTAGRAKGRSGPRPPRGLRAQTSLPPAARRGSPESAPACPDSPCPRRDARARGGRAARASRSYRRLS